MERLKRKTPLPLYVIHNLKSFTSKKQVEDYIDNTLLKSATFSLKKVLDPNFEEKKRIYFVIMKLKKIERNLNKKYIIYFMQMKSQKQEKFLIHML